MTNEELYQQAKDQVAKDLSLDGWKHFIDRFDDDDYKKRGRGVNVIISSAYERAALLAIQSAREEATLKDAIKILNRIAPTANPKEYKYLSEAVAALELIRDGHLRN